jgi:hypothetical protein
MPVANSDRVLATIMSVADSDRALATIMPVVDSDRALATIMPMANSDRGNKYGRLVATLLMMLFISVHCGKLC